MKEPLIKETPETVLVLFITLPRFAKAVIGTGWRSAAPPAGGSDDQGCVSVCVADWDDLLLRQLLFTASDCEAASFCLFVVLLHFL